MLVEPPLFCIFSKSMKLDNQEQQGEVNITRQDLYLRVRRDTNGKLKKSNEDILQRALGKAAPSGRAATGGINATYRTFLGKDRKKKRAEVNEFDKLKYEFDNLHKLLEKAEAQGFKVGRENYQPDQELESASKKKKVKPSKKRIDRQSISHESEYRPDLTNIEQGTPNFQDASQTLKQMGDDMFDALLRQEGTSPARVVLSAPFVDAIVDSTRLDSKTGGACVVQMRGGWCKHTGGGGFVEVDDTVDEEANTTVGRDER
ncbi:hypothetical protein ACFE04_026279 [Oxalis oulophora]